MAWGKFRDLNLRWYEYAWAALPIGLAAAGGAIGGACGAGAAALNIKLMQSQRGTALKFGLTGLVSLGAVGAYYVLAKVFLSVTGLGGAMTAEQVDRDLKSQPLFIALQKGAPDTYASIRRSMIDGLSNGKPQAQIVADANEQVSGLVKKALPQASDDAVMETARVITLEYDQLGAKNADACFAYATGSPPVDILKFVTPEVAQMEKAANAAVLETGLTNPQRIPSRDEVAPALRRVVQQLIATYGQSDVAGLAKPAGMDHARYCAIISALFKNALSLPRDQAVPVLRNMFGQGST